MNVIGNGSGFTVTYSKRDAEAFAAKWPCSTVNGAGSFAFAGNGDLVDATGTASKGDGDDWRAFAEDCEAFGRRMLG